MRKKLRLILGDQLSESISSLIDCDKKNDLVLMAEVINEATYVKHHKKKLVYIFSAMRHFCARLKELDYNISYVKLDSFGNSGSFTGEVSKFVKKYSINEIIVTFPGEWRVLQEIKTWSKLLNIQVTILPDDRFYSSIEFFSEWSENRKQLRLEFFYRELRKKFNVLIAPDGTPEGGAWNFDQENRKFPKESLKIPECYKGNVDSTTNSVIEMVKNLFKDNFGDIEPFYFAVTREEALKALKLFIKERLPNYGSYQDAMIQNEPWLYHSNISQYLNSGLLLAKECVAAAEDAYYKGKAPLNSVEGFIRQILGWREYVRGVYWLKMPEYYKLNYLNANKKLPSFFWSTEIDLNCLKQALKETAANAYAHHIQRLMVLGNFLLLLGVDPKQVNEWYLIVYADAYEWVELPNVSGMILYADGGLLASKPYAAGGSYINRMSNYCSSCSYNPKEKSGDRACPFNYLYWDFLARNRDKLKGNARLSMIYNTYDKITETAKLQINSDADKFMSRIGL
jgi:deoxyribodipyrimidine photolyase-related protein